MNAEQNQAEFACNEWDVGYTYGVEGVALGEAIERIERAIGCKMTAHQNKHFSDGHFIGMLDHAGYAKDMELAPLDWSEIPL